MLPVNLLGHFHLLELSWYHFCLSPIIIHNNCSCLNKKQTKKKTTLSVVNNNALILLSAQRIFE